MTRRSIVVTCFAGWHGFDLAQGLDRAGVLECLVTLASPRQIEARYGIPRQRIRRLPLAPLLHRLELWFTKHAAAAFKNAYFALFCSLYDRFTQGALTPQTRVLVAWHPFATQSLMAAKKRGIVTVLDVGSTHPLEQHAVLSAEHVALGIPKPWIPARVLAHCWMFYEVDWIAVPSTAVRHSFIKHGIPDDKLFVNPYGIEAALFKPLEQPRRQGPFTAESPLRVVVVAGLTPRKGSRVLLDVCRHFEGDQRIRFTLVGSLDPPYCFQPSDLPSNLLVQAPMPHERLVRLYHQHHVCFLPSIEEGFARVLVEAAGCGLTLLATPPTGIADLLVRAPAVGYELRDHQPSTAIEAFYHLIDASWKLGSSHGSVLDFYTRASYQKRASDRLLASIFGRV
jgi:glycosyltransferase involved in cell wall biosynthesis